MVMSMVSSRAIKIEEEFSYSEWAKRPAIANRSGAGDAPPPVRIKTRRSSTR
jgi:hypothetical protein